MTNVLTFGLVGFLEKLNLYECTRKSQQLLDGIDSLTPKSGNDATVECRRGILANILQTCIANIGYNELNQPFEKNLDEGMYLFSD